MTRQMLVGLCWLLLPLAGVRADSLYTATSDFSRLFSDRKALAVGDVLHIIVVESSSASQNMQDATSTQSEAKIGPGLGKLSFLPMWGYGGNIGAQAKGNTSRSETMTARVAVVVVGHSAAGNLLVEGERVIQVHKDAQVIRLKGEVRPQDVGPDSTVLSSKVANATISYSGSNPARPGSKVGFITRALHWLF
jgi:flagellar L-ring protein precursor FlgH